MISTLTAPNGLVLGDGTPYTIVKASGFGSPNVEGARYKNSGRHGITLLRSFWRERIIRLEIKMRANTVVAYGQLRYDLVEAFDLPRQGNGFVTFTTTDGKTLFIDYVNMNAPIDADFIPGHVTTGYAVIELIVGDPLIYNSFIQSQSIHPPVIGGVTLPTILPFAFSASGGSDTLVNNGNAAIGPTIQIYGPAINPHVQNSTTGLSMSINNTIPDGSYVEINTVEQTVLLNGTVNWLNYFEGDFWFLEPGDNIINFSSDDNTPASYAQIIWTDAYTGI